MGFLAKLFGRKTKTNSAQPWPCRIPVLHPEKPELARPIGPGSPLRPWPSTVPLVMRGPQMVTPIVDSDDDAISSLLMTTAMETAIISPADQDFSNQIISDDDATMGSQQQDAIIQPGGSFGGGGASGSWDNSVTPDPTPDPDPPSYDPPDTSYDSGFSSDN